MRNLNIFFLNQLDQAYSNDMQRKVFWISFMMLGLVADLILPLVWGIAATIPILFVCWWMAYKTEWFED